MSQQGPPSSSSGKPTSDPWHAFGYLVSGVAMYGVLGWLLDQWLGTSFLVAVGIIVGAALGIYMTWARFRSEGDGTEGPPGGPDPKRKA